MSNFLDGLNPKQSTDTLTASEWNFLINSLKNMRFTDLSDVSVDIAQEGEVPVLIGGGWVPAPMTGSGGTPVEVNWNTLVGKPFSTINLNDFIVIGNELNIVASLKIPDWNNVQNKPIDLVNNELVYGNCHIYHSCNSNKESVDWKAKNLFVGNGEYNVVIQVKHLSGAYGAALGVDVGNIVTLGKSSITNGIHFYHGNTKVAETFTSGVLFNNNLDVGGEAKAGLFYTGEVSDLNDINTNVYRGLEVMRYSQGAANKPLNSNNANGLLNIYSHGSGYGKQIAFGDSDDLYIRRMTSGSFGGWKKLYHNGNVNNQNTPWRASFLRVQDQEVIRGTATNDRLQLWGELPYISFWNEATDHKDGYIQSHSGNMLIDVAGSSAKLSFRVGGSERAYVREFGLVLPSGNILQAYEKQGTSWGNYITGDKSGKGALDVKLAYSSAAAWIWTARDSSDNFKGGFQVSMNSGYSQLYLSPRCSIAALGGLFEFYVDGQKIAELNSSGTFRAASDVQAQVNF